MRRISDHVCMHGVRSKAPSWSTKLIVAKHQQYFHPANCLHACMICMDEIACMSEWKIVPQKGVEEHVLGPCVQIARASTCMAL